jgi:predicted nucleic acid-binding protein
MDRLFLDANVLFSTAYRTDSVLLSLWKLDKIVLCSSRYAIEEARINLDDEEAKLRLEELSRSLHLFDAAGSVLPRRIILPNKDAPILLAAIDAGATHLLTGDLRHFSQYFNERIGGVLVMRPGDYLRSRLGNI